MEYSFGFEFGVNGWSRITVWCDRTEKIGLDLV